MVCSYIIIWTYFKISLLKPTKEHKIYLAWKTHILKLWKMMDLVEYGLGTRISSPILEAIITNSHPEVKQLREENVELWNAIRNGTKLKWRQICETCKHNFLLDNENLRSAWIGWALMFYTYVLYTYLCFINNNMQSIHCHISTPKGHDASTYGSCWTLVFFMMIDT